MKILAKNEEKLNGFQSQWIFKEFIKLKPKCELSVFIFCVE